jgi:hypothetical protein
MSIERLRVGRFEQVALAFADLFWRDVEDLGEVVVGEVLQRLERGARHQLLADVTLGPPRPVVRWLAGCRPPATSRTERTKRQTNCLSGSPLGRLAIVGTMNTRHGPTIATGMSW